jgi:hypothetical protein
MTTRTADLAARDGTFDSGLAAHDGDQIGASRPTFVTSTLPAPSVVDAAVIASDGRADEYGERMRDSHVRSALRRDLDALHAAERSSTRFVDELGLCGQVRVDVAVVNGALSGYELKSASDNLRRLPTQVEVYSRVLDFATLVVAENHAEHALPLLPGWWGVTCATWDGCEVQLQQLREAQPNPAIDALSLAQLLWRDEVLDELASRDLDKGFRSKSRNVLAERLAQQLSLDELRATVRDRLKGRQGWRPDQ